MISLLIVFSEKCASCDRPFSPRDMQFSSSTTITAFFECFQFSLCISFRRVVPIDPFFSHLLIASRTEGTTVQMCGDSKLAEKISGSMGPMRWDKNTV